MRIEATYKGRRYGSVTKALAKLSDDIHPGVIKRIGGLLKRELEIYLKDVAQELNKRHSKPWEGGTTATTLSSRSGRGRKSILRSVKVKGRGVDQIEGRIGGKHYLRTQEFGATITPKKAKYLTIPLKPALTSRGVPKRKKARDWKNTFVAKSKKGNLIIFRKQGKKKIIPLYVLKKRVTIPPRLGMKKLLEKRAPQIEEGIIKLFKSGF